MLVFFGSRMYGKVDEIPGVGHVATRFAHIQLIPLLPMGSFLMLAGDPHERGIRIAMSLKSVLTAWLRVALMIVIAIAGTFCGVFAASSEVPPAVVSGVITAIGVAVLVMTYRLGVFRHPSLQRAIKIAKQAGFDDETVGGIVASYETNTCVLPTEDLIPTADRPFLAD